MKNGSLTLFYSLDVGFPNIVAGVQTASIWVGTNSGAATGVLADSRGFGGHVLIKETW